MRGSGAEGRREGQDDQDKRGDGLEAVGMVRADGRSDRTETEQPEEGGGPPGGDAVLPDVRTEPDGRGRP
jgi:hypothetical protein